MDRCQFCGINPFERNVYLYVVCNNNSCYNHSTLNICYQCFMITVHFIVCKDCRKPSSGII